MANRGEVSFYRQMKICAKCFYDKQGNKRVTPASVLLDELDGSEVGKELLGLLGRVVEVGMSETNGVFSDLVRKYYVQDEGQTYFANKSGVSFNTFHTQLQRGKNKMEELFGVGFLTDLMGTNGKMIFNGERRNPALWEEYRGKLIRVSGKERKLYKFIGLDLGAVRAECAKAEFTEEEWRAGFYLLEVATPAGRARLIQRLTGEVEVDLPVNKEGKEILLEGFIGYVNYLLNMDVERLDMTDLSRRTQLEGLIQANEMYQASFRA